MLDALEEQEKVLGKEKVSAKTQFTEQDNTRLIELNKALNTIGLQLREKRTRLDTLKA